MQQGKGKERTFTKNEEGLWCSGDKVLSDDRQVSLNNYFQEISEKYDQLQSTDSKKTLEDQLTARQKSSIKMTKTLLNTFDKQH